MSWASAECPRARMGGLGLWGADWGRVDGPDPPRCGESGVWRWQRYAAVAAGGGCPDAPPAACTECPPGVRVCQNSVWLCHVTRAATDYMYEQDCERAEGTGEGKYK